MLYSCSGYGDRPGPFNYLNFGPSVRNPTLELVISAFAEFSITHSPTQRKVVFLPWGRSKRVSAMTHKVITLEFVVPTLLAIALGIMLSIGAVYLTDKYFGLIDQAEADQSVARSD